MASIFTDATVRITLAVELIYGLDLTGASQVDLFEQFGRKPRGQRDGEP